MASSSVNIQALLSDFLYKYGERGKTILEASIRASQKISRKSLTPTPGDFDYRSLVEELGLMGYSYNPSPLLRILEKEYGLIKTTLHTSNQRWFVFVDKEAIESFIDNIKGVDDEDPEQILIRLQLASLQVDRIKEQLSKLLEKRKWSDNDYRRLYRISFVVMPKLLKIYRKLQDDPDIWGDIISEIEEVFKLANKVYKSSVGVAESSSNKNATGNTKIDLEDSGFMKLD
jgi:hypothetical protein